MSNNKTGNSNLTLITPLPKREDDRVRLDESEPVLHKDIGLVEPTELDGITINRTKHRMSPFIPIRKERLVDQLTQSPSKSFGIWVQDPTKESGWRDMGTVSEQYLLLTNEEVRRVALSIAEESGFAFRESRIFWDGARFAHIIDFTDHREVIEDEDEIGLSLITRTSYDRSWKYESALMGKRFVCDNGVLSGEFFARVSFKHREDGENEQWEDLVRQGLSVLTHAGDNLAHVAGGLRKLKRLPTNDDHLRGIWKRLSKLGDSTMGKIMNGYLLSEESTLFGFFNAGTNVFWHNKKLTSADFANNDRFASTMLKYAFEHAN